MNNLRTNETTLELMKMQASLIKFDGIRKSDI